MVNSTVWGVNPWRRQDYVAPLAGPKPRIAATPPD